MVGKVIEKYLRGVASVPTENRMRILRLIENVTLGTAAVGYRTESMHGAGSPQAQRIMISRKEILRKRRNSPRRLPVFPMRSLPHRKQVRSSPARPGFSAGACATCPGPCPL